MHPASIKVQVTPCPPHLHQHRLSVEESSYIHVRKTWCVLFLLHATDPALTVTYYHSDNEGRVRPKEANYKGGSSQPTCGRTADEGKGEGEDGRSLWVDCQSNICVRGRFPAADREEYRARSACHVPPSSALAI